MIDWVTLKIHFPHLPFNSGKIRFIEPDGSYKDFDKKHQVEGSYSTKVQAVSWGHHDSQSGRATELHISGNPSKFFQGHNIFGSNDPEMIYDLVTRIASILGIGQPSRKAVASATMSRIDLTESIQFENLHQANAYLGILSKTAKTRSGRPSSYGSTVTFQKSSRYWTFVCYAKGEEVKKHKLHKDLPHREKLIAEAQPLARVELRLGGKELDRLGMRRVKDFTLKKIEKLYREYLAKIEMNKQVTVSNDVVMALNPASRAVYLMWHQGIDPRNAMSKATFYRHRSKLLRYGVDIFIPRNEQGAEIIPIRKVITGKQYMPPNWAVRSNLFYKSA